MKLTSPSSPDHYVDLRLSRDELILLMGLLETAADGGLDRHGIAARAAFAYDVWSDEHRGLDRDQLGGDFAAAIAEAPDPAKSQELTADSSCVMTALSI